VTIASGLSSAGAVLPAAAVSDHCRIGEGSSDKLPLALIGVEADRADHIDDLGAVGEIGRRVAVR
jgi:hypothetical protein